MKTKITPRAILRDEKLLAAAKAAVRIEEQERTRFHDLLSAENWKKEYHVKHLIFIEAGRDIRTEMKKNGHILAGEFQEYPSYSQKVIWCRDDNHYYVWFFRYVYEGDITGFCVDMTDTDTMDNVNYIIERHTDIVFNEMKRRKKIKTLPSNTPVAFRKAMRKLYEINQPHFLTGDVDEIQKNRIKFIDEKGINKEVFLWWNGETCDYDQLTFSVERDEKINNK